MEIENYLAPFYSFDKLDVVKKGIESNRNVCGQLYCQKVFLSSRANSAFCSARCKNQYNIYKTWAKSREDKENGWEHGA